MWWSNNTLKLLRVDIAFPKQKRLSVFGAIQLAVCISLWAANPGAQRILVVGRWLVPGRELNPDLELHNGTIYPTELSA